MLNPLEGGGEVDSGRVGAGGLVEPGSEPSPLLHCVEASFDDVAPFVAFPLLVAEVDRSARPLLTLLDLVSALGDRGLDTALAQPGTVLLRRVPLVREHPVRPHARLASPGDADLVEHAGEHARVRDLSTGQHERQRASSPIADQVDLRRQTTS